MTHRHENRRIPGGEKSGNTLTLSDLDQDLIIGDRNGRVTINLDRLARALGIERPTPGAGEEAEPVFAGAGTEGFVPDPIVETAKFLRDDGTWQTPAGGGGGAPVGASYLVLALDLTLTSERVLTAGTAIGFTDTGAGGTLTVSVLDDGISFAKMQNIATDRLIGRDTAATGDPEELTVGGGVEFTGAGGIQRSALTGDVTAAAGSGVTTIANDVVTYAKMQNVSASPRLLGRVSAGAGDIEEIPLSGTVFPTSPTPVDGQLFYRTDHQTLYAFHAAVSVWLSVEIHEIWYGQNTSTAIVSSATTGFFRMGPASGNAPLYSQTIGHVFGYDMAVVGLSWKSTSASSGTPSVYANNVLVTGATMGLANQNSVTKENFVAAGFVTAGQMIAIRNSNAASATAATPASGTVRLRRKAV